MRKTDTWADAVARGEYGPRAAPSPAGRAARVCPVCGARGTLVQSRVTASGAFNNGALIACILTLGLAFPLLAFRRVKERKTWCTSCETVFS